jgi:hypothetical protein
MVNIRGGDGKLRYYCIPCHEEFKRKMAKAGA